MSKFKVGDYVIHECPDDRGEVIIYKIESVDNKGRCDGYSTTHSRWGSDYADGISDMNYRIATNLDYIRTLTAEQMANWIIYRKNVCTPNFCKVEGDCSNAGCEKAIINFLNQPYDGWVVE